MTVRPELLGDVETIARAAGALGQAQIQNLPPLDDLKGAMERVTNAAQTDAPNCQDTQDIAGINGRVQGGHLGTQDIENAAIIARDTCAGSLGQPKGPRNPKPRL